MSQARDREDSAWEVPALQAATAAPSQRDGERLLRLHHSVVLALQPRHVAGDLMNRSRSMLWFSLSLLIFGGSLLVPDLIFDSGTATPAQYRPTQHTIEHVGVAHRPRRRGRERAGRSRRRGPTTARRPRQRDRTAGRALSPGRTRQPLRDSLPPDRSAATEASRDVGAVRTLWIAHLRCTCLPHAANRVVSYATIASASIRTRSNRCVPRPIHLSRRSRQRTERSEGSWRGVWDEFRTLGGCGRT